MKNFQQKKLILLFSSVAFITGFVLCLPITQNLLILLGGKLIGRPLNNPLHWKDVIQHHTVYFFFVGFMAFWFYIRDTEKYQSVCVKTVASYEGKNDFRISLCLFVFFFLLFILPFIIFGENSVITIHDNLEDSVPRFHYIHQHNLFWNFDKKLPILNGISNIYLNREGFTLYNAIHCLLPTYAGYIINQIICIFIGFLSMFFFQRIIFKDENVIIITLTSLAYALLPALCIYKMGVATMPFAGIMFYKLLTTNEKKWFVLAFLYPFVTTLVSIGLFVYATWALATIIICIRQRKINYRLILGLTLLFMGSIIVDSRLIYARVVLHDPLNRDFFLITPKSFIFAFIRYFFLGFYHAHTIQYWIIDWTVLFVFFYMLKNWQKNFLYKVITISLISCLLCAIIAALAEVKILNKLIAMILPALNGVGFERIYMIARLTWYIAFTASLLFIAKKKLFADVAYVLAICQIILIFISGEAYNDSAASWKHNLIGSSGITWKEFYSEKQFKRIKEQIKYNGENVCSVGYHPAILLYNDFNTIDGYLSVYPYEQQLLWHDLMLPEFERNEEEKNYFDSWGGRRYVYNTDLGYGPTKIKYHKGTNLYINVNMLKEQYNCKYVFARAELLNAKELGLKHIGTFDQPESIYIIWVYVVV